MDSKTILLIEDDNSIGEVLQVAIEIEGYRVFWAKDGREGLKLVDLVDPGVIICDMMMPVLDGFGFLREHLRRSGKRAPVIAISAMANYLSTATSSGAAAALAKPLDLGELLGLTATLTGSSAAAPSKNGPVASGVNVDVAESVERRRIEEVLRLRLDQPAPEKALHEFVDYVARLFEVPICLISIITASRQYWTAMCGMSGEQKTARGGPRRDSFCTHAVVAHSALIVQDAATNPFFKDNPFVTDLGIRFYAGVPLITRTGEAVGTLCLLDHKPKVFTRLDLELLGVLAKRVLAELDWREKRANPDEPDASFSHLSFVDSETGLVGREGFIQVLSIQACRQVEKDQCCTLAVITVDGKRVRATAQQIGLMLPQAWIGRLGNNRIGVVAARELSAVMGVLEHGLARAAAIEAVEMGRFCGAADIALAIVEDRLSQSGPGRRRSEEAG